jgi:hypothetical protein
VEDCACSGTEQFLLNLQMLDKTFDTTAKYEDEISGSLGGEY